MTSAVATALATTLNLPVPAQAQSTQREATLPEVKAQARSEVPYKTDTSGSPKQTAPLLDTPQAVTVVPRQVMQERGARDLTEVLRNTPGITFDSGENGFGSTTNHFKLRGFNASSSVFIDNARDNGNYARDVFNLEQVEIFKGPSADNGRGNGGGYVNLVTKKPDLGNFRFGEVSYGWDRYDSEARRRAAVDLNQMLAPTVAVRLNAMVEDSGVEGREFARNRPWGIAPSLAFGLGTDFRTVLSLEHQERRDIPYWGAVAASVRGMMRFDPAAASAPRENYYGLRSDFDKVDSNAAFARFEKDLSTNVTISNQTRWSRVHREARYTPPSGYNAGPQTVTTGNQAYDRTNVTISNLTNLSAELLAGGFRHSLATGLELTREESDAVRFANGANAATDLFNPNRNRVQALATPAGTSDIEIDTVAAYLNDTMHLSERWQLNGGLRVERYKVALRSRDASGAPTGPIDNFSTTETTVGGKLGVVYKPARNVSYYAAAGISHDPPAGNLLSNPDISRTGDGDAFPNLLPGADPVRSINYEIGAKWDIVDGRLSTMASLFRTSKRVSVTGCDPDCTVDPESLKGYAHQIAEGVELGAAGNITPNWAVFGGLLWMRAHREISAYLDMVRSNANRADYGCPALPAPCDVRTDGDSLAFTPRFSANLWTTYRIPATNWTLGGGAQHVGSSYAGRPDDARRIVKNGTFGKLPSYVLLNAMASYELRRSVRLAFHVDNIADRKYAVSTNWAAQRVLLGAPRTYRASLMFDF